MGKNKFPGLSGFYRLQCMRVYYFREEVIFIQVRTILAFTFISNTGTCNFTQSIYIISLNAQFGFDVFTHTFRPGFRTESTRLQFKFFAWKT